MKKLWLLIIVYSLSFLGCISISSKNRSIPDHNEISSAILGRLQGIEVVLWNKSVLFKDLDLSETVIIQCINNSRVEEIGEYYQKHFEYFSTLVFEDKNGIEHKIDISRRIYNKNENAYDYNLLLSRGLIFGQYELSPDLILEITPEVNNLPWIYHGYDSSNVYSEYNGLDTRTPVRTNYILIYDSTVQKFYDQVLAQNADRPRRDRASVQNLIQNLIDVGFNIGTPFIQGDVVSIPQGLLIAIDLSQSNGSYDYLVLINNNTSSLKPFYVHANRSLSIMGSDNMIFESIKIEYQGPAEYLQNRIPKSTLLFKMVE
jgi:hypothetical protein